MSRRLSRLVARSVHSRVELIKPARLGPAPPEQGARPLSMAGVGPHLIIDSSPASGVRGGNRILDKAKHFGMRLGPVGPTAGSILGDGHRNI